MFISSFDDDIINQRYKNNRNEVDFLKNKIETNFKISNFYTELFVKSNYFEYCLPIGNNLVLLYDYKHSIIIFNYKKNQIIEKFKQNKRNREYKHFEFKQGLHIQEKSMVLIMSTKGQILPFIYSGENKGFKKMFNLAKIDFKFEGCPKTEILSESKSLNYNMYLKSSVTCRKHKVCFNPYFIKKNNNDMYSLLKDLRFMRANKMLFDPIEQKVVVLKKNVIFICGFSFENELVLNKIHGFEMLQNRYINWNSLELFGKFGNRKLMFITKEEKMVNTFYNLEYIV
jgi:hypothetical protein